MDPNEVSVRFRLRVASPCAEDWNGMDRTAGGRRCDKCDRVVHDLTDTSAAEALALLDATDRPPCVRYRADHRGEALFRPLAVASLATAALAACQARYPESPALDSEITSTAGCKATQEEAAAHPLRVCGAIEVEDEGQQDSATDIAAGAGICAIDPSAPQCQSAKPSVPIPYSTRADGIPAHSRAECAETRGLYVVGIGEAVHEWPEGPDVVIAGVWADGVVLDRAKEAARAMLKPLAKRYGAVIDAQGGRAPQGSLVLVARVARDGGVREVSVESSDDLPQALVDAARARTRGVETRRPRCLRPSGHPAHRRPLRLPHASLRLIARGNGNSEIAAGHVPPNDREEGGPTQAVELTARGARREHAPAGVVGIHRQELFASACRWPTDQDDVEVRGVWGIHHKVECWVGMLVPAEVGRKQGTATGGSVERFAYRHVNRIGARQAGSVGVHRSSVQGFRGCVALRDDPTLGEASTAGHERLHHQRQCEKRTQAEQSRQSHHGTAPSTRSRLRFYRTPRERGRRRLRARVEHQRIDDGDLALRRLRKGQVAEDTDDATDYGVVG